MLYGNNQDANSVRANVQLVTRVRPLQLTDHVVQSPYFQVDPAQGSIVLGGNKLFQFDYVLPFDCPQHVIYKSYIEPSVNACFEGYNISIIAYGQTGAGKTFTIFGPGLLYTMNEADFGMLPRTVRQIFFKTKEYPDRQFSIQTSYLEIYDEEIRDLLSVDPFPGEIIVQEDAQTGETLFIGATRMECQTIDDVFSCLETGLALRHTGPMMLNQVSGRSHGIFTIYIQQAWTQDGCLYEVRSKLQFFDLAGSDRLNEAAVPVNSGLLALNNVIAALGDPRRKASHIPYWDSKLTTILKESLGGNSFSILIVCLSPSASDLDETVNTLNLATRAANISNRPSPNIRVTPLVALNALNLNPNIFLPISAPAGPAAGAPPTDENQKEDDCSEDELFKLRFAASQWQQLVTNAESILSELDSSGALEKETKNRIQSWLCLKEEYANCIDPEIYAMKPRPPKQENGHLMASNLSSLHRPNLYKRKNHHSSDTESSILHVIEEVSEPTPTHELSSMLSDDSSSMSDSSDSSDFTEQLDVLRKQFRETTDQLINSIETAYDTLLAQEWRGIEETLSENGKENSCSPLPSTTKRRVSVFGQANSFDPKVLLGNEESEPDDELFQEMRRLSETSDSRRLQVWQTNEQLKKAQQTLKELKQAIKIKEESIDVDNLPSSRRGDDISPRKVDELERSLNTMKEEQMLLKEQLRREDEKKRQLQQELIDDQKRIAELERQLRKKRRSNRRGSLQGMNLDSLCDKEGNPSELEHKWRWLVAEEERLIELRTEIESRSEQLDERQRREETDGVSRSTGSSKVIQPIVQEAASSSPFGASGDVVDKEAVRKEIRNMRHTRDALVLQRQALDEQQQRGRELDPVEERRMLELDEAIEAVDAAMEYKNELICSRYFELKSTSDDGLLTRLMSLSHPETRSLLCKYFQKVIDLREGSKKMEQQFAELEAQYEDQCRYIRKLSSALKHTQLEVGRRSAASASHHRHHYEHKISTAIKQLNDESSTCVAAAASAAPADADSRENRDLRRHLRQLLSVSNSKHQRTPGSTDPVPSTAGNSRTPSLLGLHAVQALHEKITGLHRLKGRQTGPATTTTVTREKNKLIIKQQPVKSDETSSKRRH